MKDADAFTMLISADIQLALKKGELQFARELLDHLHAADIADIIEGLEEAQGGKVFELLPQETKVETFEYLEDHLQEKLLQIVPSSTILPVIEDMSPDDRADFFRGLSDEEGESLFLQLSHSEKQDIRQLTSYEEETAGAVMTSEYVAIPGDYNVRKALDYIREVAPHRETIYYMYVVDSQGRLQGHVSLRDIVLAHPDEKVSSLMNPNIIAVTTDEDQEEVAMTIQKYDFLALPVVDSQNRLVGIVTHDDILDVMESENTEDAHKMAAVSPLEDAYMQTPFWVLVQKRVFWLSVLFIGEMFTSTALNHFEEVLKHYIMLVFFIPLIISAGGNAGSQSSSLIVRGLAVGNVSLGDWWKVLRREFLLGFSMGCFLGLMGLGRAMLLGTGFPIALIVMITVMTIVMFGAFVGALLPMFFRRIGLDPAVTSAPFVASLVDVVGIVLYFMVARAILGM